MFNSNVQPESLYQLLKRLEYFNNENPPKAVEINDENYSDFQNVQIASIGLSSPGSNFEKCAVSIYDEDGNRYYSNYATLISLSNLYKLCPVIKDSVFWTCKWEKDKSLQESMENSDNWALSSILEPKGIVIGLECIPDGWIHIYIGNGCRYFIKTVR